jgi:hypothetical protein
MIEVKITADTLGELHAQLLKFVAELAPQTTAIAATAKDESPKPVEKAPKPPVAALHAPVPPPPPPIPDAIDYGALREEVRAAAVAVSKTDHRTAGVVACLQANAGVRKVDEIAEDKLGDVLAALRALL